MSAEPAALVAHVRRMASADRARWHDAIVEAGTSDVVFATCHRVEVYGTAARLAALPRAEGVEYLLGLDAARHLVAVAVGLDSVVAGEDQVLHQLREAVAIARARRVPAEVDRLADLALRAGRRARSWRTGAPRSLADVAVDRLNANGPGTVAVIGAGEMGRLAAAAILRRGATVRIASRRTESALRLAGEIGAATAPFALDHEAAGLSGVVVALRGEWPVSSSALEALIAGSVPVVDLSAPSALPPAVIARLGPLFTSIDDLAREASVTDDVTQRRLHRLVDETVAEYAAWIAARNGRTAAAALTERAVRERRDELDALWRRLPSLDALARREIERMSEHLAERLLREPLSRLGRDVDGRHERAARDLFGL